MASTSRLSALDKAFLDIEQDPGAHMHVGGIVVVRAEPLHVSHGGVDIARIRSIVARALAQTPRLRQRIAWIPRFDHPIWVDAPKVDLDFHLRHVALPRPGTMAQLHELTGRIFSQRLDRERPLWELWVVEGLEGERLALIPKFHHCMIDGVGAVGLMSALAGSLGQDDAAVPAVPAAASEPSGRELWWAEVRRRATAARDTFREARTALRQARGKGGRPPAEVARGLEDIFINGLRQASVTPLNGARLGAHRRVETLTTDLRELKQLAHSLGGTLNDVVLTIVTGASRRYLLRHGTDPGQVELFRALVPANTRKPHGDNLGNQVAFMLPCLPVQEPDPRARHRLVCAETLHHKEDTGEIAGAELLERLDDSLGLGIVTGTLKLAMRRSSFNLVVTNVPGPRFPLSMPGFTLERTHAFAPLFPLQGLAIALFSYDEKLFWGLIADWESVPDLSSFVADIEGSLDELRSLVSATASSGDQPARGV